MPSGNLPGMSVDVLSKCHVDKMSKSAIQAGLLTYLPFQSAFPKTLRFPVTGIARYAEGLKRLRRNTAAGTVRESHPVPFLLPRGEANRRGDGARRVVMSPQS